MFKKIKNLSFFFSFCKKKWGLSCAVIFFNTFAALLEGLSFSFLLVGFTFMNESPEKNFLWATWAPFFSKYSDKQLFIFFIFSAIFLQMARSGLAFMGQMMTSRLAIFSQIATQKKIYEKIFSLSYPSVSQLKMGELMDYLATPAHVLPITLDAFNRALVALLMIAGYLCMMFWLSFPLTIAILFLIGLAGAGQRLILKKIMQISERYSKENAELSAKSAQNLEGLKDIHFFQKQSAIFEKISQMLSSLKKNGVKLHDWRHLMVPINEMMAIILVGSAIFLSLFFFHEKVLFSASLLTFLTLTYRFGTRLQVLTNSFAEIAYYLGPLLRVRDFLLDTSLKKDQNGSFEAPKNWEKISLREIDFSYKEQEPKSSLKKINLELKRGKTLAIVGHSGAGKSTLIDLLLALYRPNKGSIFIDGRCATTFDLASYKALFGVVSQQPFLFHASVEENIRFANESATQKQIEKASIMSDAHSFIMQLPEKYKTVIGERGHKLSGGERQRLALARALICDPEILVLDEATSQLDSGSENFIQQTLKRLRGEKTIIMVAHRLSTVAMADEIFVMERGQIIESGDHATLLSLRGAYHHFWSLQH